MTETFEKYKYSILGVSGDLVSYSKGSLDCPLETILDEYKWLQIRVKDYWDTGNGTTLNQQFDMLVRTMALTAIGIFQEYNKDNDNNL